ncbi:MAG: Gfo/Idh/MocA family protein [Burkholderiales bacterium]
MIGLGQIGQGYDYSQDNAKYILTHATAFARHRGFNLVGGVDPERKQRQRFEQKFHRPAFPDLPALMCELRPEVLSICVPTAEHANVFTAAMQFGPTAVICEKPIAATVLEARQMLALARRKACTVLVNYMRRYEPGVLALRDALRQDRFGEVYKGVVWYSKGLINNGSHFIDLLRFLLGEAHGFEVIRRGRKWNRLDPEPDLTIQFGKCAVQFIAAREECFSMAQVELIGTAAQIIYADSGRRIEVHEAIPDITFPGYRCLESATKHIENDFDHYQWWVADHLYRHLTRDRPLYSDGSSAIKTLTLIERIISSL